AMTYFKVPKEWVWVATVGVIFVIGLVNYFGPKHSGSFALSLAIPTVVVVVLLVLLSAPHLTLAHLEPSHQSFRKNWTAFVGVILALSGVESIANLTGVMTLDRGSTMADPKVGRTASK